MTSIAGTTPVATTSSGNIVISDVVCDSSVYVGAVVIMTSNVVYNAIATSVTNANFIGICIEKIDATTCNVLINGVTPEIYTGLDDDKKYFLSGSAAGAISNSAPAPGSGHIIIRVGEPFSTTKLTLHKGIMIKRR